MTTKYNNVYINETAIVTGPYEKKGPLHSYFDKGYDDLYCDSKTFEQAESKLIIDAVDILLEKINKTRFDIDLHKLSPRAYWYIRENMDDCTFPKATKRDESSSSFPWSFRF